MTYQTSNPADDSVLIPNYFIHGQVGGQYTPYSVDNTAFDPRKRWRHVQNVTKDFWQRWLIEFLSTLSARKKWFQTNADFRVEDIVLVIDPDMSRGHWLLGRITEVFPGPHGHLRVANVQISKRILRRSSKVQHKTVSLLLIRLNQYAKISVNKCVKTNFVLYKIL